MCSIFGVVFEDGLSERYRYQIANLMSGLAAGGAARGTDATGAAWVGADGAPYILKDAVSSYAMLRRTEWLEFLMNPPKRPLALLGHTRKATHGANTAENAHPFVFVTPEVASTVGVHNGVISNHQWLRQGQSVASTFAVDSANMLAALHEAKPTMEALCSFFYRLTGSYAVAAYHRGYVVLARNTSSPCVIGYCRKLRALVFASTEHQLRAAAALAQVTLAYVQELTPGIVVRYNPMAATWRQARYESFSTSGYTSRRVESKSRSLDIVAGKLLTPSVMSVTSGISKAAPALTTPTTTTTGKSTTSERLLLPPGCDAGYQTHHNCRVCKSYLSSFELVEFWGASLRLCLECAKVMKAMLATVEPYEHYCALAEKAGSAPPEVRVTHLRNLNGVRFRIRQWEIEGVAYADALPECSRCHAGFSLRGTKDGVPEADVMRGTLFLTHARCSACIATDHAREDEPAPAKVYESAQEFLRGVISLDAEALAIYKQSRREHPTMEYPCAKCHKKRPLGSMVASEYCANFLCDTCEMTAHAYDYGERMAARKHTFCEQCDRTVDSIKAVTSVRLFLCKECAAGWSASPEPSKEVEVLCE